MFPITLFSGVENCVTAASRGCCDTCVDIGADIGGEGDRCATVGPDDVCVPEKDGP